MEIQASNDTGWINKIASDSARLSSILSLARNEHSRLKFRLALLEAGAMAHHLSMEIEFGLKQRRDA